MAGGGVNAFASRITTNTDTELVAAPGANSTIRLITIKIMVEAAQAGGLIRIEDGVGGDVIAVMPCDVDTVHLDLWFTDGNRRIRGYPLTANTKLNAETTADADAATVVVSGLYEITG